MSQLPKKLIASCLAVALIAVPCLGCGGESDGRAIITMGLISDLSGPSSPSLIPIHDAIEDMAKYYNEERLIPSVRVEIATYNTYDDRARQLPGYDWVRERGADVIVTTLPTTGEVLKSFAVLTRYP